MSWTRGLLTVRLRSLLFLPAAALVLTACSGGDGSSAEAEPYVDAMTESLAGVEDGGFSEEDARCFSEKFIDVVGLDRVEDAGEPEDFGSDAGNLEFAALDLTRDEANSIYDNYKDCGQDPMKRMQEDLADDDEMSPEAKACVEDLVTEDRMREVFIAAALDEQDNEEAMEFSTGLMQCVMSDMGDMDLGGDADLEGMEFDDLDLESSDN